MKLEELMASVGDAVQQAQSALDQAGVSQYLSYFQPQARQAAARMQAGEPETGGPLRPREISFLLPGKQGERQVSLPVLALSGHSRMAFDQVTVQLNVALEAAPDGGGLEAVPVAQGEGGHKIELTFRRGEPSEAVSRISDGAGQLL